MLNNRLTDFINGVFSKGFKAIGGNALAHQHANPRASTLSDYVQAIGSDLRSALDGAVRFSQDQSIAAAARHNQHQKFLEALGEPTTHLMRTGKESHKLPLPLCEPGDLSGSDFSNMAPSLLVSASSYLRSAIREPEGVSGAVFENCSFDDSDLHGRTFVNCDFTDATFTGANLRGADLSTCTGLTVDQLSKAGINADTQLPHDVQFELKTRHDALPDWATNFGFDL